MNFNLIIVVLIAWFAVVLAGAFIIKSSQKTSRKMTPRAQSELQSFIDEHNELNSKFIALNNRTSSMVAKKNNEFHTYRDPFALKRLTHFVNEYNEIIPLVDDYLQRSQDCLMEGDGWGSHFCINQAAEHFGDLEELFQAISAVESCEENRYASKDIEPEVIEKTISFFEGCKTKEEIDARYRNLARAFHPDSNGGDTEMFKKLQEEYEKL